MGPKCVFRICGARVVRASGALSAAGGDPGQLRRGAVASGAVPRDSAPGAGHVPLVAAAAAAERGFDVFAVPAAGGVVPRRPLAHPATGGALRGVGRSPRHRSTRALRARRVVAPPLRALHLGHHRTSKGKNGQTAFFTLPN